MFCIIRIMHKIPNHLLSKINKSDLCFHYYYYLYSYYLQGSSIGSSKSSNEHGSFSTRSRGFYPNIYNITYSFRPKLIRLNTIWTRLDFHNFMYPETANVIDGNDLEGRNFISQWTNGTRENNQWWKRFISLVTVSHSTFKNQNKINTL